jgi:hypothetical protein
MSSGFQHGYPQNNCKARMGSHPIPYDSEEEMLQALERERDPEGFVCSVCAPLSTELKHRVKTGCPLSPERGIQKRSKRAWISTEGRFR